MSTDFSPLDHFRQECRRADSLILDAYAADTRREKAVARLLSIWSESIDEIGKYSPRAALDHCTLALCMKQDTQSDMEFALLDMSSEETAWSSKAANAIMAKRLQILSNPMMNC